ISSSSHSFVLFLTTASTTEIYTLSLHDALPICPRVVQFPDRHTLTANRVQEGTVELVIVRLQLHEQLQHLVVDPARIGVAPIDLDRKSTRLNSSHVKISYAVFCLKKKKKENHLT